MLRDNLIEVTACVPEIIREAEAAGVEEKWTKAARESYERALRAPWPKKEDLLENVY